MKEIKFKVGGLPYTLFDYGHSSDSEVEQTLISYRFTKIFLEALDTVSLLSAVSAIFCRFASLESVRNCEGSLIVQNRMLPIKNRTLTRELIIELVERYFCATSPYIAHPIQLKRQDRDYMLFIRQGVAEKCGFGDREPLTFLSEFDPNRFDSSRDEVFIFQRC